MARVYIDIRYVWEAESLSYFDGLEAKGIAGEIMEAAASHEANNLKKLTNIAARPGILLDFANAHGMTPLMAAAAEKNDAIADFICGHPLTHVNRADRKGMTALHYAARHGNADTVYTLLKHKADPRLTSNDGQTAHDLAGNDAVRALLDDASAIQNRRLRNSFASHVSRIPEALSQLPAVDELEELVKRIESVKVGQDVQAIYDSVLACDAALFKRLCREKDSVFSKGVWAGIFVTLATHDRADLIRTWHAERPLPPQSALQEALFHGIAMDGAAETIRELMLMGANPYAKTADNRRYAEIAITLNRRDSLAQMMTFSQEAASKKYIEELADVAYRSAHPTRERGDLCSVVMRGHERLRCEKKPAAALPAMVQEECENGALDKAFLLYLEGLRKYAFRKPVDWAHYPETIKMLLSAARSQGRTDIIDMLGRKGHSLEAAAKPEVFLTYKEREALTIKELSRDRSLLMHQYSGRRHF